MVLTPPHSQGSDPDRSDGASTPGYSCKVFVSADFLVTGGANTGDPLGASDDVCQGDVYQFSRSAEPLTLRLTHPAGATRQHVKSQVIADGSQVGVPDEAVSIVARHTLMAPDGGVVTALVFEHLSSDGTPNFYVMPLSPMARRTDYALIRTEPNPTDVRLADIVCVSFARGTTVTMADGRQVAIETLKPGDRMLTRDHGPQPLRWIGRATLRAIGSFAPVVITKGTLGNAADLIVSQHHRVFMYHRRRPAGIPTAELLVQARHLVDGTVVFLREGGYVDYFTLVFDRHEIIYAEGIPAESLMVNEATVSQLPEELAAEVQARFPGMSQHQHFGTEADAATLVELGGHHLFKRGAPG